MTWEVSTYANAFARGALTEGDALGLKVAGGVLAVRCPCCSLYVQPFAMADLRGWPAETRAAAGGHGFVCDGCWSKWAAQGRDLDGEGEPFSEAALYALSGAPAETVEAVRAAAARRETRFAASEGRRRARPGVRNSGKELHEHG